ncbi:hypothetical protein E4T42_05718 [Aureobasidium subglaciale]|uniref:Uncharacterized protein n=1 Tax=Aureobasidium subglaciale (strain EXF-2481) TaxID=1043005 RepID=A0A074YD75_AURSE|nr:uncharacterized protein AUEXF2481DRAFT_4637 [Aureobasidium subglaciale EXF-2481]KAI5199382.1 hypothetical protein E4T38_07079 [Aureobasidium subglaciale]KAI5200143.1 hypothetical protein E4T39_05882 [Aureobasidium subglaciale]KAI5218229.1 hypothetical protein E4T40_07010 [Aureobasidium subglaciale]KAI5221734.1 hypothetical protein E4T41_06930 [Aureobasidium subglaciale]KAI5239584.1 hypothetical protein E4T43_06687 [Aureobasidium subglaciale]
MGDNWLSKQVQGYVAGAGKVAGNIVYSVGNGVNNVGRGVGDSITNTTRYWGQGVAGYGNNIKDASRAGGPRVPTGGNPLGLSGPGSSKTLMPGGKLPPGSQQRNAGKGTASNPLGL